jgi:hypothetical protein
VEADIDPGARILDAAHADSTFDAIFEQEQRASPASRYQPGAKLPQARQP